jgi:hypothetical protein
MDWNSLVNTATKAINTDDEEADETTIVDLESSAEKKATKNSPVKKSTLR